MYLSAIGYGMVVGGIFIDADAESEVDKLNRAYRQWFAGGFITTLCWVRKRFLTTIHLSLLYVQCRSTLNTCVKYHIQNIY